MIFFFARSNRQHQTVFGVKQRNIRRPTTKVKELFKDKVKDTICCKILLLKNGRIFLSDLVFFLMQLRLLIPVAFHSCDTSAKSVFV